MFHAIYYGLIMISGGKGFIWVHRVGITYSKACCMSVSGQLGKLLQAPSNTQRWLSKQFPTAAVAAEVRGFIVVLYYMLYVCGVSYTIN